MSKSYAALIMAHADQFKPEEKFRLIAQAIEHGELFRFPPEELAPLRREGVETFERIAA